MKLPQTSTPSLLREGAGGWVLYRMGYVEDDFIPLHPSQASLIGKETDSEKIEKSDISLSSSLLLKIPKNV